MTYLPVDRWIRGFLAIGMLFLVSSAFTLAKVIRDQQESASAQEMARLNMMLAAQHVQQGQHLSGRSWDEAAQPS